MVATTLAGAVTTEPGAGAMTVTTGGCGSSGSSGFPTCSVETAVATFPEGSVAVAVKMQ